LSGNPKDFSVHKFDSARAGEYQAQSRIALAGYDACHELAASLLSASVGSGGEAHVLVAGAGGGAPEIVNIAALEPLWRFTAVDPSEPMLSGTVEVLKARGLDARTEVVLGKVGDLPAGARFDAATLVGVLHHLPGDAAKHEILADLSSRMKPGAPLILACNHYVYEEQPLFLKAWMGRWRRLGATPDEIEARLGKIRQAADPPASEAVVAAFLAEAGFEPPLRFFSSLYWGAWITRLGR
jgi:tRNA (cmo5U34)-methyltransferase